MGKADKIRRNLEAKKALIKSDPLTEVIESMNDNASYTITNNGKPVIFGLRMSGAAWKELLKSYYS